MKNFRFLFFIALSLFLSPAFCQGQVSKFTDLDTDSDGKVTKEEFKKYAKGRLPDFDLLDEFTDQLDVDKDGVISETEYDGRMEALRALNENGGKKKELTSEDLEKIAEAKEAYKSLAELVSQGDWEKAVKEMTKKASDDYAIGMVTQSLSLTQMKLPPQMDTDAVNEAKDATIDVIKDYKLDDIDMKFFLKNPKGDGDYATPQEEAKARQKNAKAQQAKLKAQILTAIDANDQRWEIVTALRKAQKGATFNRDVLGGKVSESDIDDKAVFLTVVQDVAVGQIAIPIVARMTSEEGKWKYAGIDPRRTQRAMQLMMQKRRGGGDKVPAEPDTDF